MRHLIISDIPAWVCQNCGEAEYDEKTSNEIDNVMKKVHEGNFRAKPMAAGKISLSEIS